MMSSIATKKIAVLGGGIAGLTAAHRLANRVGNPQQITLIESSDRLGGWMQSLRTNQGSLFEKGPRTLRPSGKAGIATLQLVSDLGLEDDVHALNVYSPAAKNRFIYSQGQFHVIPNKLFSVFKRQPLIGNRSVMSVMLKEVITKKGDAGMESIHEFFERRTNKQVADMVIDPFCRGIFGGDSRILSLRACFPMLYNYELSHGSIMRGIDLGTVVHEPVSSLVGKAFSEKWTSWTLENGLESIPLALEESLRSDGVQILKGKKCKNIDLKPARVKITMENQELMFDHIISAAPSFALAPLIAQRHQTLADDLDKIPWVTMGVVNLEYDGDVNPVEGFGVLIPSSDTTVKSMGVVFDSCACPEHDRHGEKSTRFTVMMGGWWFKDLFGDPYTVHSDDLIETALHTMKTILLIDKKPHNVFAHVLHDCIPQYKVGHTELLLSMNSYIQKRNLPLTLIGNSYEGVGVNDCIFNAQKAVDKL